MESDPVYVLLNTIPEGKTQYQHAYDLLIEEGENVRAFKGIPTQEFCRTFDILNFAYSNKAQPASFFDSAYGLERDGDTQFKPLILYAHGLFNPT